MTLLSTFREYAGYFHDGSIREIEGDKNRLIISIESGEVCPEWYWNREQYPLSSRNTISGKLCFENVTEIIEDGIVINKKIEKIRKRCTIYDLNIQNDSVEFDLIWEGKDFKDIIMQNLKIRAFNIDWKNIPDLFDDFWRDEYAKKSKTQIKSRFPTKS